MRPLWDNNPSVDLEHYHAKPKPFDRIFHSMIVSFILLSKPWSLRIYLVVITLSRQRILSFGPRCLLSFVFIVYSTTFSRFIQWINRDFTNQSMVFFLAIQSKALKRILLVIQILQNKSDHAWKRKKKKSVYPGELTLFTMTFKNLHNVINVFLYSYIK